MATRKSKKTETPVETAQTAAPQTQAGQQPAGLSLTDLITVTQIIQLSSQRGAFRAEEMGQVGALYTKLVAFLQSTGALTPPDAEGKKDA